MNSFNYGSAAQASIESEGAKHTLRKKTAKALICNRVTSVCLQTQCPHRIEHSYLGADCNRHTCMRDQVQKLVDCLPVDID